MNIPSGITNFDLAVGGGMPTRALSLITGHYGSQAAVYLANSMLDIGRRVTFISFSSPIEHIQRQIVHPDSTLISLAGADMAEFESLLRAVSSEIIFIEDIHLMDGLGFRPTQMILMEDLLRLAKEHGQAIVMCSNLLNELTPAICDLILEPELIAHQRFLMKIVKNRYADSGVEVGFGLVQ